MNPEPVRKIVSREEVIFYDTDSGGVVSNIAYLRFIEKARCQLFAALGMDLVSMNETRLFPTVIRTEIDYRKPARLGDKLCVEAAVTGVEKVRISCRFTIYLDREDPDGAERTIFAEALQNIVLVQMPEGKVARPPQEWRE